MTAITDIRKAIADRAGQHVKLVLGCSAERGLIAGLHREDIFVGYGQLGSFEGVPIERTDDKFHPGWEVVLR